jgi:hypothetical protein
LVVASLLVSSMNFSNLVAQWEVRAPGKVFLARMDGNRLRCGLATEDEMKTISKLRAQRLKASAPGAAAKLVPPAAAIEVTYSGFTPKAEAAFQRAVDMWSALLITTVPIRIEAVFESLDTGVLGGAGPGGWLSVAAIPFWLPLALFDQLAERDLDPGDADISATFSNDSDWYFGLDGRPGDDEFDFVSVVFHELAHGLGFFDSFDVEDGEAEYGIGSGNDPMIFDVAIFDKEFDQLVDEEFFSNGSTELHDAITGIKLFWGHRGLENVHEETATAPAANGGGPVMLWAPEEFVEGTSISHLDEDAYPTGTPNALMSPFVSRGKVTHQPGPVLLAMLHDMGYTIREEMLQIPQFGTGGILSSDVVVTNRSSTETATVTVNAWDPTGNELDEEVLFGAAGLNEFDLPPLGSRTLSTASNQPTLLTGSMAVSSNFPVSAVVRFDLAGVGVAGVGSSPELRAAIAPVRRSGNLSTGVAIRNVEVGAQTVELTLKNEIGEVVANGTASRTIEPQGRIAEFIHEIFPDADTTDFKGEICVRSQAGRIAVVALELDFTGGVFTTLPVSSID